MMRDARIRTEVTKTSHFWFFLAYLPEYVRYPFADFHREMFALTEDVITKMVGLMAFRGSAKSTIFTLSYPIWAVLGSQQKKFVLLVAQTQPQARLYLANLKRELESNELLRQDLGPFEERQEEWSAGTLVIPKYGARITAISTEQSIRGLRHGSHRPDLIICDDLEDIASVKTYESRQKTQQWFMGDVIPCGDKNTKVVVIGNMLHEGSLLMRLKSEIENKSRDGVFRQYPLLGEKGAPTWPGKFRTQEDITTLQRQVGDDGSWNREYLLKIVSNTERVIHPEWIVYYDQLPAKGKDSYIREVIIGVDVAISQAESADFTAFVPIACYADPKLEWCAYILPSIINKKMTFPETVNSLRAYSTSVMSGEHATVYVEDFGYQRALAQQLQEVSVDAKAYSVKGLDKRERIALTSAAIKEGRIRFPRSGAEELIRQLVGFGQEKHDDIADAFTLAARKIIEDPPPTVGIWFL